ncbi:MAG: hypothetical protein N3A54_07190, partial [Patescibacteria group bacterium]|nr:hypothetical protein [Patescibacteria group bacterium]
MKKNTQNPHNKTHENTSNTSYPEPPPTIQKPLIPKKNENIYELQNEDICLEIRKYQNNAWEIEVRYDKVDSSFVRQPYTGRQEILPLSCPQLEIKKNILQFHDEKQMLSFNVFNGDIHLFFENTLVFNTRTPSFSWHKTEQSIFENLMSLKVTDFSQRAPFAPRGQTFSTHMIRFRYKRPKGIVLGLPGQAGELNRNGYRFELSNTDTFKHTPDRPPLYQSWPILFHEGEQGGWIAIFHDNPSRTFVDVGEFYKDSVTFESISGNTRIFLIAGETLDVVSQKLCRLLGTNDRLPLWAFGYHQCRFSYQSTDELRNVIKNMREHDFPLDAVYCDIDAMDEFRVFTHNKQTFGDIHQFTKEAKDQGVQTISIVDPGVKVDSSYEIYKELIDIGGYLKNPDGTPFIATVWPGDSLFPHFFSEKVQTWWAKKQCKWLESGGYAGVWN